MSFWQRWLRQPQSIWVRKAIFQVHLWTGIGLSVYVFVVCVSGSAMVFRPELTRAIPRGPTIVAGSGPVLSDEQLKEAALRAYPGFEVRSLSRATQPNAAVEVVLQSPNLKMGRLFNPFTGSDIGRSVSFGYVAISWFLQLHDNLLGGETGRLVNGAGGLLLTILSLTGLVIWWPGIRNWRRSLMVRRGVGWKRFNWDLHSALGIWTAAVVFMFAVTGAYLVFQEWLTPIIDYIEPYNTAHPGPRRIDDLLTWLPRLHFGRFRYRWLPADVTLGLKILWVVIGLTPAILSLTGVLMWWNRVVRKRAIELSTETELVQSFSPSSVVVPWDGDR